VSKFQRDKSPKVLRGRDLANGEEATARTPVAVEPTQVEDALGIIPAKIRHIAVTINLRDRAQTDDRELALLFRESLPVRENMFNLGRRPGVLGICCFDFLDRVLRRDVAVEVEVAALELHGALPGDGETLRSDVAVFPVVVTGGNHLLERLRVVDRETEDVGSRSGCDDLERILALSKQREFVESETSCLQFVKKICRQTSQAFARQNHGVSHGFLLMLNNENGYPFRHSRKWPR